MQFFYVCLIIYMFPIFLAYFLVSLLVSSIFTAGEIKQGNEEEIYISKDLIHSDYVFRSEQIKELFPSKSKFVKVGWGDRKIFLETRRWEDLKAVDFLTAFFGMNETVLRVEFLEELPYECKKICINKNQLEIIKVYIKDSFTPSKIEKKKGYYEKGEFYKSELPYNCIRTCNNWVNYGLYLSKATNRIWCPFSFLI